MSKPQNLILQPRGRSARRLVALDPRHKKPTVKSLDRRIKKIRLNEELSHKDTFYNSQTFSTSANISVLNAMLQGDTNITRDGNNISVTSVQWRFRFQLDTDNLLPVVIRHLVLWDSQPNGALPGLSDVLDNSVITTAVFAPYNSDFQKRFKILHDKVMVLNPQVISDFDVTTGTTSTLIPVTMLDKGKRSLSRVAKYDANAGDITDIQSNALISIFVSNTAAELPTAAGGYRVYFKDD